MAPEAPQSFIVREECEKAASHNGFRRVLGEEAGWRAFASTTAHGIIYLAAESSHGPWLLATDHAGVVAELDWPAAAMPGPGAKRYIFNTLSDLYTALNRAYTLAISLPDAPLREFERRVADLPRTTDVERLVVQRIGQDIFRARLMDYWQGRCPLTGISAPCYAHRTSSLGPTAKATPNGSTCIMACCCQRSGMLPSTERSSLSTTPENRSFRWHSATRRVPNCAGTPQFR